MTTSKISSFKQGIIISISAILLTAGITWAAWATKTILYDNSKVIVYEQNIEKLIDSQDKMNNLIKENSLSLVKITESTEWIKKYLNLKYDEDNKK